MATTQPRKKTVFITGCTPGGIGHSLATEFHSRGLHVIASARSKSVLSDLEAMGIDTVSLDVTNRESIEEARGAVERLAGGRLDILVNNAGRNYTVPALDIDLDEVRATFESNVYAVMAITQSFIPMLISAKGLIINIGSVAAVVPYVFGSIYNASKAALHAYSRTLRLELAPFSVRVLVIVTGGVQSRIARTERQLPKDSLYLDIDEHYQRRLTHSQEGAMETGVYAKGVVDEALRVGWSLGLGRGAWWVLGRGEQRSLWWGAKVGLVRRVRGWLGSWAFDLVLPRMFGLDVLRRIVVGRLARKSVIF